MAFHRQIDGVTGQAVRDRSQETGRAGWCRDGSRFYTQSVFFFGGWGSFPTPNRTGTAPRPLTTAGSRSRRSQYKRRPRPALIGHGPDEAERGDRVADGHPSPGRSRKPPADLPQGLRVVVGVDRREAHGDQPGFKPYPLGRLWRQGDQAGDHRGGQHHEGRSCVRAMGDAPGDEVGVDRQTDDDQADEGRAGRGDREEELRPLRRVERLEHGSSLRWAGHGNRHALRPNLRYPMTRFVVDASAVLHLASAGVEVSGEHKLLAPTLLRSQTLSALHEAVQRGEIPADVARDRLARIGRMPIRLLGDAVLRRRAWELADQLGWASTYNAEYVHSLSCRQTRS